MSETARALRRATHAAIAGVTADIEGFRFNKAIARLYEFVNALRKSGDGGSAPYNEADAWARAEALSVLTRLIAPFAPHLAEECWALLGRAQSASARFVFEADWPEADPALLVADTLSLGVQINGKRRAEVVVAADASAADVEALALADPAVQRHLSGLSVRKVVVVPGRIVNIVAA